MIMTITRVVEALKAKHTKEPEIAYTSVSKVKTNSKTNTDAFFILIGVFGVR
jgi:hypothetical protein